MERRKCRLLALALKWCPCYKCRLLGLLGRALHPAVQARLSSCPRSRQRCAGSTSASWRRRRRRWAGIQSGGFQLSMGTAWLSECRHLTCDRCSLVFVFYNSLQVRKLHEERSALSKRLQGAERRDRLAELCRRQAESGAKAAADLRRQLAAREQQLEAQSLAAAAAAGEAERLRQRLQERDEQLGRALADRAELVDTGAGGQASVDGSA